MQSRGFKGKRQLIAIAAGFGLVATAFPAATAAPEGDNEQKIDAAVQADVADGGKADVWVRFADRADLSAATGMGWEERGQFVYDALNSTAEASQAEVRAQLEAAGVEFDEFFISNSIFVPNADEDLVAELAANVEVSEIGPDVEIELEDPVEVTPADSPAEGAWGLDNINAPAAWEEFSATGEGMTVGIIDTGVELSHPILQSKYRGDNGDGTVTNDYNWFDYAFGSDEPVDPVEADGGGHGTHVAGTVLGGEGDSTYGVAPDANWIAANPLHYDDGTGNNSAALLHSLEWMLAPTDLDGENADPAMRPHVVNNSWGVPFQGDPALHDIDFFDEPIAAWNASGIFGVFSNGNEGEQGCGSAGLPAAREVSYSVGAYDVNNTIAEFSSRGPGQDDIIRPSISAPGVDVMSSYPGGTYVEMSGTSMAAPHVSGAVAALWSAAPDLIGDVEGTRALLNQTAIDTEDLSCGGTAENNNVYGEGRLDLYALVDAAVDDEGEDPGTITRYAGDNRYETAADVAGRYADADTVYITTGTAPHDALTGSAAASRGAGANVMGTTQDAAGNPAPILLTKPEHLPSATKAILSEIGPSNIVILGNEGAVSADIEAELGGYASGIERIGGADRYETAAMVAEGFDTPDTVYVALGIDGYFADALSGSAIAGRDDAPVLLTKSDSVPAATAEYLASVPDARVVVLGGENIVSDAVYQELGADARLAGEDRYRTSLAISGEFDSADILYVATGRDYPDALTGGAYAGAENAPLVLVNGTQSNLDGEFGQEFQAELERLNPSEVVILGGPNAVSEGIEADIAELMN